MATCLAELALPGEYVGVDGINQRAVQVEEQRVHGASLLRFTDIVPQLFTRRYWRHGGLALEIQRRPCSPPDGPPCGGRPPPRHPRLEGALDRPVGLHVALVLPVADRQPRQVSGSESGRLRDRRPHHRHPQQVRLEREQQVVGGRPPIRGLLMAPPASRRITSKTSATW